MTRSLEEVRSTLQAARDQLAWRLLRIRDDASRRATALSADSADRAQEQENDEVLECLGQSTEDLLRQYEHALARFDGGHYGICEDCGYAIEPERLDAVVQATRCACCMAEAPAAVSAAGSRGRARPAA